MGGRLIYLMGPSGSGKDSLLNAVRERLTDEGVLNAASAAQAIARRPTCGCRIARRVITRSAEAVGEEAVAVSLAEFEREEAAGAFALSWRANGLAYGVPRQIDDWLAAGEDVLVNGSRAYLSRARQRYPELVAVLLRVDGAVLRERLLARGREAPAQIEQRMARNALFEEAAIDLEGLHVLDNSSHFERTVDKLLALIGRRACA
nr:phosphonate metabolism protein/1,5-bisphosphokinase (PRPP-forming) PhnN [uncultured Pseudomonas sp.]